MTAPSNHYVISIMSRDSVGIIHQVSRALSDLQGNIADVRQSILSGYFTMILLVSVPEDVTRRAVERKLAEADANLENPLSVMVSEADNRAISAQAARNSFTYVLTATCADRVGIVASVSAFCAGHQINIIDLSTTVSDGAYIMILVIDLEHAAPIQSVRQDLQRFAQENQIRVVLQHHDIFRAVNEINLPLR